MKKRSTSKMSIVSNPSGSLRAEDSNIVERNGVFTFSNGDRYTGEYTISGQPPYVTRQGHGVYDTDDFNKYEAVWNHDKINDKLHIRFNNETEYKGNLDENGRMSGKGTYYLPDGASIEAEWKENKLYREIRYKEPLGFIWNGKLFEDGKVIFMAGNHFWDDMNPSEHKKSEAIESSDM